MSRTTLGFEIRAVGLNQRAAQMNGVRIGRIAIFAFALGGAFGGLAGAVTVLGMNNALVTGFSGNFGFLGIAVALVARLNPIWVIPSAFLFAILRVGSNSLQVSTGLSPTMGEVLGCHVDHPSTRLSRNSTSIFRGLGVSVAVDTLTLAVALMIPILWAALGETIAEQAGVLNIGIEGVMLCAALATAAGYRYTGNLYAGLPAALAAGLVCGIVLASLYVQIGTDQVVTGILFNILALGLTTTIYIEYFRKWRWPTDDSPENSASLFIGYTVVR